MLMHFQYLQNLSNLNITSVLDIGAHFGHFTLSMHDIFSDASYHMIEANTNCEEKLKSIEFASYDITLLSDIEKDICYYMNRNDLTSTGNSYYRELTEHFNDENVIEVMVKSKTLDGLFPNTKFDLIKLDTQGSEIDILKGGIELLKFSKYVLMECAIIEYNKNSPKIDDVISFMADIGFVNSKSIYNHSIKNMVIQQDILFTR